MPYQSQYANKCKDCGKAYAVGEEIGTNGKQSPNQKGEMKDHWCIDGKNCKGVQTLTNTPWPTATTNTGNDMPKVTKDPTTAELRATYNKFMEGKGDNRPVHYIIIGDYIEQREACENIGITNPITIGMIWNNRVRDRQ
jgi:hypothetical protein